MIETTASGRILHFFAEERGPLVGVVAKHCSLAEDDVRALLALGAIFCDGKRVSEERDCRGGEYLRVHQKPRRFPAAHDVDWSRVVVAEESRYLVIDKPAAVPIHATLDNEPETVLSRLGDFRSEHLFVTQRLDRPTRGLCLVARTKTFQATFNRWLADGAIEKRYRAITDRRVPLGTHVAYMAVADRAPKQMFDRPAADTSRKRCELVVHTSVPLEDGGFESVVELVTGRTHQIRAQFAYLGMPLRGDTLYDGSSAEGGGPDVLGLQAFVLAFPAEDGSRKRFELPRPQEWPAYAPTRS